MYCKAIFHLKPADVEDNLQQFHMHSESSPMFKTCARPCDQLFPKTSQKRAASIQTLQIHRNRVSRGCSPFFLFTWPVVPTLNSPALYCPDHTCLQKRGCGWLLCKHKSPWEIKISFDALCVPPFLSARLVRRNYAASARDSKRFAVCIQNFSFGVNNFSILCQFRPRFVSFPAACLWRSFLPQRSGRRSGSARRHPPKHPMCWRRGLDGAAERNVTGANSSSFHSAK